MVHGWRDAESRGISGKVVLVGYRLNIPNLRLLGQMVGEDVRRITVWSVPAVFSPHLAALPDWHRQLG